MNPLLRRVASEKRHLIIPLAVIAVLNVLAYFIIVRPLAAKSAGASDRATAAANSLRGAEQDMASARALVNGKSRADEELQAFYQKVLPADETAARRMTYASLPALARKTSVSYEARDITLDEGQAGRRNDTGLGKMTIRMVLSGNYENIRQFIYELETSPDFVIVDDVSLIESNESSTHTLTIDLSTYYRTGADGA